MVLGFEMKVRNIVWDITKFSKTAHWIWYL